MVIDLNYIIKNLYLPPKQISGYVPESHLGRGQGRNCDLFIIYFLGRGGVFLYSLISGTSAAAAHGFQTY